MALTNIELYEALKRDLNEDAARMIAEAVPKAGDLVTNAYLDARVADIDARFAAIDARFAELKSYIDSRLLRYTAMILVPVGLTMIGTVGALIALVAKL